MTDLDRLIAETEIRSLKARYWHAVDRRDESALLALFTPGAIIPAHGDVAETRPAPAFVANLIASLRGSTSLHLGGPGDITVRSADAASAIWAMEDRIWAGPDSTLPFRSLHGWGHYHDEYRRTADGWRIDSFTLHRIRVETS